MKKVQEKGKIYNIHIKTPAPPQTEPYGRQTPSLKLKMVARKAQGFSMQKTILPLNPRRNTPSVKLNQRRKLPLKRRTQCFIKYA
jgi:hypothetical protein